MCPNAHSFMYVCGFNRRLGITTVKMYLPPGLLSEKER